MKKTLSYLLTATLLMSMVLTFPISTSAVEGTILNYTFSGKNADEFGYAEGTLTLSSDTDGSYYLYWANDTKALDGYYEIDKLTIKNGKSASFNFGYHTAIPADATRVIAVSDKSDLSVSKAAAVYSIPRNKQLNSGSGKRLYTFNSYSDVHIDNGGYYVNAEKNWKQALKYATDMDTDFIVSSGDMVTNASGPDGEWLVYEKILADSNYLNPVWESDGNHDMRSGVSTGLTSFVKASGTDNTIANYDANKPYYYVTEQSTGDIFIFMALESDSNPSSCDEFSKEQINWLVNLLDRYYGTGVNIYLIEHSPIKGFGAGDRMEKPYYKAHLSENYMSTVQFKALLKKYPKLIWMSGHTHEDYSMGYNYSNENDTACHMIHNPAVAGSTWASASATSLDYNNGVGYNSQGYYVETYENQVIYYGANLTDELIYPAYCYIMDGSRNTTPEETNPTEEITTQSVTDATGETGSTLPTGIETKRVYFANTLKWQFIDCYSWSDTDTKTCTWPGYGATYYGTNEQGIDLYYCDIPATHDKIIWNNAGKNYQTENITLDGINDFFTPASEISSKNVPITATVWDYNPVTEPTEPTNTTTEPTEETTNTTTEPTEITTTEKSTEPPTDPVDYKLGDVNMDNAINIDDVSDVQYYIVSLISFTDEQTLLADVNFDDDISILDATMIQKHIAGLINEFAMPNNFSDDSHSLSANNDSNFIWTSYTLKEALAQVKELLNNDYTFSSYDQYQNLKKYYFKYKNMTSTDNESEIVAEFERLSNELNTIAEHIGVPVIYPIGNIYYFENTNDWETVNCYAWNGSSEYAAWPGKDMQKIGKNNGHDVYGVKFDYAGQYTSLIFNNGSSQTVDIALSTFEFNCFSLDGTATSGGKLNVKNLNYDSEIEPTAAPTTTKPVSTDNHYALCYYNSTYHGWSDIDTFFTKQSDGTYTLEFIASNSESISCNVYDNSSTAYNCVASSTSMNFAAETSNNFELVSSSSRGKSLTIKGLSSGSILKFTYNPADNTLNVMCSGVAATERTDSTTETSASTPGEDIIYTLYMAPAQDLIDSGNIFKANIKDSANAYHGYAFEKTDMTYNGAVVYRAEIKNPSYTNVIKIQYQTLDSASTFVGQVVDEKNVTLEEYNNKIMVCSSAKSGSLCDFITD